LANLWAVGATGLLVLGWTRTLANRRRRLVGLVAGLTLALLLVWPFTEAGRFLIPLVPCVLVAAVEGLAVVGVPLVGRKRARPAAALLVLGLSLPYSVYALVTDRAGAQRRTSRDFDAACDWLAHAAPAPGPVLTRHPGEVYWQTRRHAVAPRSDDPETIPALVDRFGVAYLLVDEERYANAPTSVLATFVHRHPGWVREVWRREAGRSSVTVYAVATGERVTPTPSAPRTGADRSPRTGGSSAG
jgi:hypothetical protein